MEKHVGSIFAKPGAGTGAALEPHAHRRVAAVLTYLRAAPAG